MADTEFRKRVDEDWKRKVQAEKAAPQPRPAAPQGTPEAEETDLPLEDASFIQFIAGLATQALIHLGAIENPLTHTREQNLAQAKYTIDAIQMLQDKTRGNLSPQEEDQLTKILSELQMAFVQMTEPLPVPKPPKSPKR